MHPTPNRLASQFTCIAEYILAGKWCWLARETQASPDISSGLAHVPAARLQLRCRAVTRLCCAIVDGAKLETLLQNALATVAGSSCLGVHDRAGVLSQQAVEFHAAIDL